MLRPLLFLITILTSVFINAQNIQLDTELYVSGLSQPVGIENAGDSRLFVIERQGTISIIQNDGSQLATKFLDISSQVSTNSERGLLGLAFHPDYSTNGYFYVNYTNTSGASVISRFSVSEDANIADATSELVLLSFSQPFANHNGGDITFGPDAKLYIASGDGGSGGDPGDRAQDLSTLLGKILRLDVDIAAPYIPNDNPFVNDNDASTRGEIWAYGLRNPFRFSFDLESVTNDFWIADVGQNEFEELNKVPNNPAGENYGWRCFEANSPFNQTGNCPQDTSNLTFPFASYGHQNGRASVTGGRVYRGAEFESLQGLYIFADFVSGELGSVNTSGNINFYEPTSGGSFTGFGVNVDNVLYVASISGSIYKVIDATLSISENLSNTQIEMFPNPASTQIDIEGNFQSIDVSVYSILGELVIFKENYTKKQSINISTLSNGLYLVHLQLSNGSVITRKLVINK